MKMRGIRLLRAREPACFFLRIPTIPSESFLLLQCLFFILIIIIILIILTTFLSRHFIQRSFNTEQKGWYHWKEHKKIFLNYFLFVDTFTDAPARGHQRSNLKTDITTILNVRFKRNLFYVVLWDISKLLHAYIFHKIFTVLALFWVARWQNENFYSFWDWHETLLVCYI